MDMTDQELGQLLAPYQRVAAEAVRRMGLTPETTIEEIISVALVAVASKLCGLRLMDDTAATRALLAEFVSLGEMTHRYGALGGHDHLGADFTCAGCALRTWAIHSLLRRHQARTSPAAGFEDYDWRTVRDGCGLPFGAERPAYPFDSGQSLHTGQCRTSVRVLATPTKIITSK